MRILVKAAVVAAVIIIAGVTSDQLSPWPSAMLIRLAFDAGGVRANAALGAHVPAGVSAVLNETYEAGEPDARLDVFYPTRVSEGWQSLPTVVWIHGGGFLAGSKDQTANYARILSAAGYTVAAINYSLAPGKTYPTPLREANAALDYLQRNAARLHVDVNRFVLAGDSAGALLAAQLANLITSADYARLLGIVPTIEARQLAGALLYCGPYAMGAPGDPAKLGWFGRTVLWSYSGRRDFARDRGLATLAITRYLTSQFPPTFLSVGNADPLAPQSQQLAQALAPLGVQVDTLFFAPDYVPPLPHEYQFDLDFEAARTALERSTQFLAALRQSARH